MAKKKGKLSESITCRELFLVDENGLMRALLTTSISDIAASLRIYDKDGGERCILEVDDNDVIRFCFMAKGSKPGLAIALVGGQPSIRFYDGTMKCVGEIGLEENSEFSFRSGKIPRANERPPQEGQPLERRKGKADTSH